VTSALTNGTELRDGRYVVVGVLGEGSQGSTYDAVDKREGRPVAIKRFDVRGARTWKNVELAEREARVLAQLSHPRLPGYVEHFDHDGSLYLVMERIPGESLASMKTAGRMLAVSDVERMVRDVGAVLAYLHGRAPPVIHRDIKPGNVLRRPDGSFAVVDFGAVRDVLRPEGGSTVVGTFGYMAPEQFQGRATAKTDIYALGATALAVLTGREPDRLPHKGLAIDVDEALRGVAVAKPMRDALLRMLSPDPDARPSSVDEALGPLTRDARAETRARSERRAEPPHVAYDTARNRKERRREEKRRRRDERAVRRAQRHRGKLPPIAWPFVIFGLLVARIAVIATTKIGVPALLHFLAQIFGRSLHRVAEEVRNEGDEALSRIDAVDDALRGVSKEPIRTRVHDHDDDDVIDAEVVEHEPDVEPSRRQR